MPYLERGLWTPPFGENFFAYSVCQRVIATLGRTASGTFSVGEGAFLLSAPQVPFFTRTFVFHAPGFWVFFPSGRRGPRLNWIAAVSERKNGIAT